jgi:hypothetical protein
MSKFVPTNSDRLKEVIRRIGRKLLRKKPPIIMK